MTERPRLWGINTSHPTKASTAALGSEKGSLPESCSLSPDLRAKVAQAVEAHPEATQLELAGQIGVSRSTVGRSVRARRAALALAG
jgi:hypothetical protein